MPRKKKASIGLLEIQTPSGHFTFKIARVRRVKMAAEDSILLSMRAALVGMR
jgi:hypothetical protein